MASGTTTSYTLAQLHEIEAAYATGATSVGHGDKRVSYRSLDEMERIMAEMRRALGITSTSSRPRVSYIQFVAPGQE